MRPNVMALRREVRKRHGDEHQHAEQMNEAEVIEQAWPDNSGHEQGDGRCDQHKRHINLAECAMKRGALAPNHHVRANRERGKHGRQMRVGEWQIGCVIDVGLHGELQRDGDDGISLHSPFCDNT
jgi:hypothetical protein